MRAQTASIKFSLIPGMYSCVYTDRFMVSDTFQILAYWLLCAECPAGHSHALRAAQTLAVKQ